MYSAKFLGYKTKQRLMQIRMRKLVLKKRSTKFTCPSNFIFAYMKYLIKKLYFVVNFCTLHKEKIIMNTKNRESRRESIQKEWIKFIKTCDYVKFMDVWDIKAHEAEMGLEYLDEDDLLKECLHDVVEDNDNLFSVKEVDVLDFGALPPIDKSHIGDYDDDDSDRETVAVDRKRVRRKSGSALRKHEKDDAGAKQKKKPRVFVEEESGSALSKLAKDDVGAKLDEEESISALRKLVKDNPDLQEYLLR